MRLEEAPTLPRISKELEEVVRVLLEGPSADMKNHIAQAHVRRNVVGDLILDAKREATGRAHALMKTKFGNELKSFQKTESLQKLYITPPRVTTPLTNRNLKRLQPLSQAA